VTGSTNDWFDHRQLEARLGRMFEPDEQRAGAAVCIIGETVRREIYGGT
jgi:putative ABC transport system permease protein